MLFAVEGGGFFSASASGYSKGLTLLLLGHKSDEKHMRIAPWNQYQSVDRDETDTDLKLAARNNRLSRGCASFVCFGRASAGLDGQSPLKVGPTQPQYILPTGPDIEADKELNTVTDYDIRARNMSLRSSMKKSLHNILETSIIDEEREPLGEETSISDRVTEKRKVQWTDTCGKELTEIREFETSEHGESDDEFGNRNRKTCSCRIM